jgi:hypothetical protein
MGTGAWPDILQSFGFSERWSLFCFNCSIQVLFLYLLYPIVQSNTLCGKNKPFHETALHLLSVDGCRSSSNLAVLEFGNKAHEGLGCIAAPRWRCLPCWFSGYKDNSLNLRRLKG